jgi:hypothetical protein
MDLLVGDVTLELVELGAGSVPLNPPIAITGAPLANW